MCKRYKRYVKPSMLVLEIPIGSPLCDATNDTSIDTNGDKDSGDPWDLGAAFDNGYGWEDDNSSDSDSDGRQGLY